MGRPVVSIIIPCYRQGHFLAATLKSVLAQSWPAIEPVVINDGSDDSTEEVARQFGDRIHYVWQPNAGLSQARNKGIRVASGKYLLCLDSDDLLHPDALTWLVEAAEEREDVMCVMGARTFQGEDFESGALIMPPRDQSMEIRFLQRTIAPCHAILFSRSMALACNGFDPTLRACEDWDFWLRLIFAGARAVPVHRVGAYYRQHPTSMSSNFLLMATYRGRILRRTLQCLVEQPMLINRLCLDLKVVSQLLRARLASEDMDAAFWLRQEGRYLQALHHYFLSVREGRWSGRALVGACKLLPHWVIRLFSTSSG